MATLFSVKSEKKNPSKPINIINSNLKYNSSYSNLEDNEISSDEYILNSNIFNPSKMSPPNDWKIRLENRIQIYYSSDSKLNIEKYK